MNLRQHFRYLTFRISLSRRENSFGDLVSLKMPSVLFVCVHNAGRSQMAAALVRYYADDKIEVRSAGSAPADTLNPIAIEAMAELGIDLVASGATPKVLEQQVVADSDVVITMGCGDTCPIFPGKRYEDWALDDPAGQGLEVVRGIREQIDLRVRALIVEILGEIPIRR